ncbi:MAG: serine/threonine protein kinase [Thermoanaerobaculia bacterium]|nr:serine/threonine protein kinase [Thermoanaerobaculia bacterium]
MRFDTAIPIGKGGTGEVLKAWDSVLQRHVALKLLSRADPEAVARMLREARSQARIKHPNVCGVYEVGETDGRPFIAMQYIEGEALDEAAKGLTPEAKALLLRNVCLGVQAAHAAGLIHRDLKPANILVERLEDGTLHPWVLDFGIAREHDAPGVTATGEAIGTPGYMSPEQVRGDLRVLDRRSDVYSLGAVLYNLLAGRPPYVGDSSIAVLVQTLQSDPVPLSRVAPEAPVDLVTLATKCLEREPDRRYPSAKSVADELDRYLAGEPIRARPVPLTRRLQRWVARHRAVALTAAAALCIITVLGAWSIREAWQAERRQELSRQIGGELEQIDAAILATHLSPSHDFRPVMHLIEDRAEALIAKLDEEPLSPGLSAYIRGRVAASLGDFEAARESLELAMTAPSPLPEVRMALGWTLAELYEQAVQKARRIRDPEERDREMQRLATELREPALANLKADSENSLRPAQLVQARIALLEERWDEALAEAADVLSALPWLYEADLIIARVHLFAAADHQATGEHEAALEALDRAAPSLAHAIATGRSDPRTHMAHCSYRSRILDLQRATGGDLVMAHQGVLEACDQALAVDPETATAWYQQARAHWLLAERLRQRGEDPGPLLEELRIAAGKAADLDRSDHLAPNLLGIGWLQLATFEEDHGQDPRESSERALQAFARSQEANPAYRHPYNNRANVLLQLSNWEMGHGVDPTENLQRAVEAYAEAIEVDPEYILPLSNISLPLRELGVLEKERGRDPHGYWDQATSHLEAAQQLNPRYWNALNHSLLLTTEQLAWWLRRDPEKAEQLVESALEVANAALEVNSEIAPIWYNKATAHRLAALAAWLDDEDPDDEWQAATAALQRAFELDPNGGANLVAADLALDRARAGRSDQASADRELAKAKSHYEKCFEVESNLSNCRYGIAVVDLLSDPQGSRTLRTVQAIEAELAPTHPDRADLLAAWRHARAVSTSDLLEQPEEAKRCSERGRESLTRQPASAEARAILAYCDGILAAEGPDRERATQSLLTALADAPTLSYDPLFATAGR